MRKINRRNFLKTSVVTASALALNACGGGGSSSSSPKPTPSPNPTPSPDPSNGGSNNETNPNKNKKRVLVYLMLNGGNDSFNMLVPKSDYNTYSTSRSNLAIPKAILKNLNFMDSNNKEYGLHPAMPKVTSLFNNKKLAFISNIGPLVDKTTKTNYVQNSPLGLMSHADQRKHWLNASPNKRTNVGWFGKLSDEFQPNKANDKISMNISLSGTNILQNGQNTQSYAISEKGSVGLKVKDNSNPATKDLNAVLLNGFNSIINKTYSDNFEETYMATTRYAQVNHEEFSSKVKASISHSFEDYSSSKNHIEESSKVIKFSSMDKSIGQKFKKIAQSIKAADSLGHTKQTYYIDYIGWDHHDELKNNHERMLMVVDNALDDFQKALEELGVDDRVITFIGSDFGRSLTSNGNGTDHAWGGNVLVMGKDIAGGKIYGDYPSLTLNSSLDIGGGVLIPTISTDEMYAELLLWYGVDKKNLKKYLPNIEKFYSLSSSSKPIGFIS